MNRDRDTDRGAGDGRPAATQPATVNSIESARRVVADIFESRIDETVDAACAAYRRELPEFAALGSADAWDNIWRVTYFTRQLQAAAVRGGRIPDEIPHDAEIGRLGAVGGMSFESVIRSYQLGGGVAWQAFLNATHEAPLTPEIRAECIRDIARLVRGYEERLISIAAEAYRDQQARDSGRGEAAVLRQVRRLLDGVSEDADGIRYRVAGTHLAAIASGPGAEQAAEVLREAFAGERLAVRPNDNERIGLIWIWHRLDDEVPSQKTLDARIAALEVPEDAGLAIGDPCPGLAGFRSSHRQAGGAYVVAQRIGRRVTRYRDVSLELLALADESATQMLAEAELAGLEGDDATTVKLRRTLLTYFESGQNAASTAARLGVNDQTVARHLRTVRERIGCYPQDRRAELELALRYRRLQEQSPADWRGLRLGPPEG